MVRFNAVPALFLALSGCIVVKRPPEPAPPPLQQDPPRRRPERKVEVLEPEEEPAGRTRPAPGSVGVRMIVPLQLEGRTRAKDNGHGGGLEFDVLDLEEAAGIELTGSGLQKGGETMTARAWYFSFDGEEIQTGAKSYGGAVYPPGTNLESRLDWAGVEIRSPGEFHAGVQEVDFDLGLAVSAWWLGMEVGEDSIDSMGVVAGPAARLVAHPVPVLELGAEGSADVGIGLPFPGYAGATLLDLWAGVSAGSFSLVAGYTWRSSVTKTVNLDSNEQSGSVDRDRVAFSFHGPFIGFEVRF